MSGTSITIKGETIPLENATLDLEAATITCSYSEALANAFTGWMPVMPTFTSTSMCLM